jgi:hypothetical protein
VIGVGWVLVLVVIQSWLCDGDGVRVLLGVLHVI